VSFIRAIILSAGRGVRIEPLTSRLPKSLIHLAGVTLIERLIHTLDEAGIEGFTVGLGWKGELLEQHLRSLPQQNRIDTVHVDGYEYGPLKTLLDTLESTKDEQFVIVPADFVVDKSILSAVISDHIYGQSPRLITIAVDRDAQKGAPVHLDADGQVIGLDLGQKHTRTPPAGRCAMAIAVHRDILQYCDIGMNAGDTKVSAAINRAIVYNEVVRPVFVKGYWYDIDTVSDILLANDYLLATQTPHSANAIFVPEEDSIEIGQRLTLAGDIAVEPGVKLIGPTWISRNCRIAAGAAVGPYVSMAPESSVGEESSVSHSVLLESARIQANRTLSGVVLSEDDIMRG
jgi:NDP-sugar pyrophosphorylase family protein